MNRAYFYALGKRKTARATIKLFPNGEGNVLVNGQKLRSWSDTDRIHKSVLAPLDLLGVKKDYDIEIRVSGGGKVAQSIAAQLGVARALVRKDAELRTQLRDADLLTRDPRRKERKKPGLRGARKSAQWSKR